jgi:hypothetical protein
MNHLSDPISVRPIGKAAALGVLLLLGSCGGSGSDDVSDPGNEPRACTADVMQCADGSYVGRTGPNCEFVCPVVKSHFDHPYPR